MVPALVDPANQRHADWQQLGADKNTVDNSSCLYSCTGLDGILFINLASDDEALSAASPKFCFSKIRLFNREFILLETQTLKLVINAQI